MFALCSCFKLLSVILILLQEQWLSEGINDSNDNNNDYNIIFIERHFPMVQWHFTKHLTVGCPVDSYISDFLDGTNFDQHAIFYHQREAPMDLSNLYFIRIHASATLISRRVNLIPMQFLDPAPSGRNWKAWMESFVQT